jgi:hypothetical protein
MAVHAIHADPERIAEIEQRHRAGAERRGFPKLRIEIQREEDHREAECEHQGDVNLEVIAAAGIKRPPVIPPRRRPPSGVGPRISVPAAFGCRLHGLVLAPGLVTESTAKAYAA